MDDLDRDDLSAAELQALSALPRECAPSQLLEERTVHALRERGILRPTRAPRRRIFWRVAAVAAGIALFTSGVAIGQWTAGQEPIAAADAVLPESIQPAARVQRAGTAYVRALAAMAESMELADALGRAQAREVALAPLWAAANEIARIAPDERLAEQLLQGLEQANPEEAVSEATSSARHVVWF